MTTPPTSTYYSKAFCVKCLADRNRTGGVWRNRMFFCAACAQLEAPPATHVPNPAEIVHVTRDVSQNWAESNMSTQPATQQEAQEPEAWYVTGCDRLLDEDDAKAEARHIGGTARAMPLYTAPQPSPTPQAAESVLEDAARYRWLRRWKGQEHEPPFTVQHEIEGTLWGGDLDAAIDAAMAANGGNK